MEKPIYAEKLVKLFEHNLISVAQEYRTSLGLNYRGDLIKALGKKKQVKHLIDAKLSDKIRELRDAVFNGMPIHRVLHLDDCLNLAATLNASPNKNHNLGAYWSAKPIFRDFSGTGVNCYIEAQYPHMYLIDINGAYASSMGDLTAHPHDRSWDEHEIPFVPESTGSLSVKRVCTLKLQKEDHDHNFFAIDQCTLIEKYIKLKNAT